MPRTSCESEFGASKNGSWTHGGDWQCERKHKETVTRFLKRGKSKLKKTQTSWTTPTSELASEYSKTVLMPLGLLHFCSTLWCSKLTFTTSKLDFWTLREILTRIRWCLALLLERLMEMYGHYKNVHPSFHLSKILILSFSEYIRRIKWQNTGRVAVQISFVKRWWRKRWEWKDRAEPSIRAEFSWAKIPAAMRS